MLKNLRADEAAVAVRVALISPLAPVLSEPTMQKFSPKSFKSFRPKSKSNIDFTTSRTNF